MNKSAARNRDSSIAGDIEALASRIGLSAEHVLLEGDEITLETHVATRHLLGAFSFRNRLRGTQSCFELFDDGYMSLVETGRRKHLRRCAFDVRFIEPHPAIRHRRAHRLLSIAKSCLLACLVAVALVSLDVSRGLTGPLSAVLGLLALASVWLYAWRREERIEFRTRHGRVAAIVLVANIGSIASNRREAQALSDALAQIAKRYSLSKRAHLRGEIREHYRLFRNGLISAAVCREAVDRTLASFV